MSADLCVRCGKIYQIPAHLFTNLADYHAFENHASVPEAGTPPRCSNCAHPMRPSRSVKGSWLCVHEHCERRSLYTWPPLVSPSDSGAPCTWCAAELRKLTANPDFEGRGLGDPDEHFPDCPIARVNRDFTVQPEAEARTEVSWSKLNAYLESWPSSLVSGETPPAPPTPEWWHDSRPETVRKSTVALLSFVTKHAARTVDEIPHLLRRHRHERAPQMTGRHQLRVLSLGAGVQSSTLYLMACAGEFGDETPEVAVFADTQWEPALVYEWLSYLEANFGHIIPIARVTQGAIRDAALSTRINPTSGLQSRVVSLPIFLVNPNGTRGMLNRQCTRDFKIRPIRRAVRAALVARNLPASVGIVEQWIGISTDEAMRMKDSDVRYITHRWPLIERNMSRTDCLAWLASHGLDLAKIPKSACLGCPYTDNARWRSIRANPSEWADVLAFDESVRSLPEVRGAGYLHSDRVPLGEVDLSEADETPDDQVDLFMNECEGMCGV